MASITLKDYLISLSTKGSISDSDLLPLLDSGADNALKKITKGALVNLSDIDGFTEFSSSIEGDLFALSFASGATVETSLQQQIDINNLGAYTQSLKSAIIVDGTDVQIIGELRADKFYVNYITSSVSLLTGSNEFGDTLADRHTFIGDVYINGDGPIGLLQLNTFSGSQISVNSGLSAVTGAFSTELGELQIQNVSQNLINDGISAVSGAIVNELSGIQSNISSFNNVFSGVSAVTGAFATELGELQTQNTSQGGVNSGTSAVTGAFATELGGIQTTLSGHRDELSGIEAWTASLDDTFATDAQVADAVAALNTQTGSQNSINSGISAVSGAFATELGQLQNNVTDFTNVLSGVAAVSGAIVTELGGIQNNITSFNGVFGGVSAVTGAFATELGEIQTQLTNRRGELNGLEAYTASLKSVGLISSSAQISVEISGSGFTSASGEFEELTLTKGDGTTAQVDLSPRKVLELVKNKDPQTLPKGTPVYVSGSTGNAAHIYAASASRADRMPAAFVLNQELAFDAEGYGIVVGYINGVNTSTFNEGDNVYVGESGGYTNVKPTGNSNRIQKLGNVIAVDAVNGSGVITGAGRSNDVPNIQEGYMWVGNSSDVATQFTTSSVLGYGHDATFSDVTANGVFDVNTNDLFVSGSRVGIGTAAPAYTLDVSRGSSGVVLNLEGTNAYDAETGIQLSAGRAKISGVLNSSGGTPGTTLRFYTMPNGGSVTENVRIESDGDLNVLNGNLVIGTSGKGIDFSANANATGMTSELLDDYEEGTWTPTLTPGTSGTITVDGTSTKATYTKIGRAVTLQAYIVVSSISSPVGRLSVGGFPFTVGSNLGDATAAVYNNTLTGNPGGWPILRAAGGFSSAYIDVQEGDGTDPAIDFSDHIQANSELTFSLTYFV